MQVLLDNSNHDGFLSFRFVAGAFLQSSLWRSFLDQQGKRSWQLVLKNEGQTRGFCLLYENQLPLGKSYLYAPKGPLFDPALSHQDRKESLALLLSKIRDLLSDTKKREEIFLKLDLPQDIEIPTSLLKSDDVQPRDSWILELGPSLDQLLSQMHPKTRYNINLAQRHGVKIVFSQVAEDLKYFLELIKKTATRNQISVHSDDYYHKLWSTLLKHRAGYLALARVKERVLAANIVLNFGLGASYVHGGSDYKYRALMAPHLLQWESIKKAKEQGKRFYDFGGVAPTDGSRSRWEGLSRFKKGFGGQLATSPGAYSLIYDQGWYRLYRYFNKLRRILSWLRK